MLLLLGSVVLLVGIVLSYRSVRRLAANKAPAEFPSDRSFRIGMALILIGTVAITVGVLII